MFKRIAIIGLGLIGGSLGLAIKKQRLSKQVIGVSRKNSTLSKALKIGAVDRVTKNVVSAVKDSDLIIVATSVLRIPEIVRKISGDFKKGSIVIDVGSTKNFVVKEIEKDIPEDVNYVGCHPMAGSEKKGIDFARDDLFKGNHCILTRTKTTKKEALLKIKNFWERLGMKVAIMSPARHDRIISSLSHLPHAVSVTLMNALRDFDLELGSGGLRDTTRIAASDPEIWVDIFLTNKKNILSDIENFEKNLKVLKGALEKSDNFELFKFFARAKTKRQEMTC